ncbi:MAG: hypothetical protein LPH21_03060 [Shewanella sp.]|nr:hypothetical protein [Shewanella sp.]
MNRIRLSDIDSNRPLAIIHHGSRGLSTPAQVFVERLLDDSRKHQQG